MSNAWVNSNPLRGQQSRNDDFERVMQQAEDMLNQYLAGIERPEDAANQISQAALGTIKDLLTQAGLATPNDFVRNAAQQLIDRMRQKGARVPAPGKIDSITMSGAPDVKKGSLLRNAPPAAAAGVPAPAPANPVAAGAVIPSIDWRDRYKAEDASDKDAADYPYQAAAADPANAKGVPNYGLAVPVQSEDYNRRTYDKGVDLSGFEVSFYGYDWARANYNTQRAPGKIEPLTNFWWGTYPKGGIPGSVQDPNQWMPNPYSDPYMDPVLPSSEWVPATAKTNVRDVFAAIHNAGPGGMSDSQFQALARQMWEAGYYDYQDGELKPYDVEHPEPPRFDRNDQRLTRGVQRLAAEVDAVNQTGGNATFMGLLATRRTDFQKQWNRDVGEYQDAKRKQAEAEAEAERRYQEAHRHRPFAERIQRPQLYIEELTQAADALAQQMLGRDATPEEASILTGHINGIWSKQYDQQAALDARGTSRDDELGAPDYVDPNKLAYDTYKGTHADEMKEHNLLGSFDFLRRLVGGA